MIKMYSDKKNEEKFAAKENVTINLDGRRTDQAAELSSGTALERFDALL